MNVWMVGYSMDNLPLEKLVEGILYHLPSAALLSLLGAIGAAIVHYWRQWRYGVRMLVRVGWVEQHGEGTSPRLIDKVILVGSALELTGSTDAAIALKRAFRKKKGNGMLDEKCWQKDRAQWVLNRIRNKISQMFATGAVARAMQDGGVTRGEFALLAFSRGDEISVMMARREDLAYFMRKELTGVGSDENAEMAALADVYLNIAQRCGTVVVLYM